MNTLKLFAAIVFLIFQSGPAATQTWICDVRASAGFDRDRGYEVTRFRAGRSYLIKSGIQPEELSLERERNDRVFQGVWAIPASIQDVGHSFTTLCRHTKDDSLGAPFDFEWITCDRPRTGHYFIFDLRTGLFTLLAHGFESEHDRQSWIEVGECRRIR